MPGEQVLRLPSLHTRAHIALISSNPCNPGALINRRRTLLITLGSAAIIAAAAVLVMTQLHHKPKPPVAYTNISRNFKTCLLTTTANPTETTPAWTAIQTAVRNKPINAQHVTAPKGPTPTLLPYLNSLTALHCQLIITAGQDLTAPLITIAKANPDQHFANISPIAAHLPNVHDLVDNSSTAVTQLVDTACQCQ